MEKRKRLTPENESVNAVELLQKIHESLDFAENKTKQEQAERDRKYQLRIEIEKVLTVKQTRVILSHMMDTLGVNQKEYAAHIGVTPAFVSAIMTGRKQIPKKLLREFKLIRNLIFPATA